LLKKGLLGVIGHPIGHTASPAMVNAALRHAGMLNVLYVPVEVAPRDLGAFCRSAHLLNFIGFNVTIPHKVAVMKHLTRLDRSAREVEAVNTVKVDGGKLTGYNTDLAGVLAALPAGLPSDGVVTVVGVGGAARAAAIALKKRGFEKIVFAGRRRSSLNRFKRFTERKGVDCMFATIGSTAFAEAVKKSILLINATPVGMHPNTGKTPVPPKLLHPGMTVFDMVYNPVETRLLREARARGAETVNGVKMLVEQGAEALRLWLQIQPDKKVMERAVIRFLRGGKR